MRRPPERSHFPSRRRRQPPALPPPAHLLPACQPLRLPCEQSNKSGKAVLDARLSLSGKQLLEGRASDDLGELGTPVEWSEQREPILNLVAAVLGAGVLGAWRASAAAGVPVLVLVPVCFSGILCAWHVA